MLKWLWLSVFVLFADQITKWLADSSLSLYETIAILPSFNITLAYNTGAAFSFLANEGGWQRWFFVGIALVISLVLVVWLAKLKPQARLEALSLSLILGGAVGNVIDRLLYGHVIDFIDIYYGTYHWPAFNIADSAIVLGAILLIIDSFKPQTEHAQS